jgi:hypothetical protein
VAFIVLERNVLREGEATIKLLEKIDILREEEILNIFRL